MRIGILIMVIGLVLAGCEKQPAIYGSHSYNCCVENTGNLIWRVGQRVTLHWQPTPPGRTTDPNPRQIVLSISITGPFASIDALKQATSQGLKPTGVRTINAAPVIVNDRGVLSPISQLDLPADLPPGYYNLATEAGTAGGSSGGGAIVVVVPGP